jgi:hypothetical protein
MIPDDGKLAFGAFFPHNTSENAVSEEAFPAGIEPTFKV